MKVYVVMCEDRRRDLDALVYRDRDAAIARARSIADDFANRPEDVHEEPPPPGWIYFVDYSDSDEVCCVWVYETEVL